MYPQGIRGTDVPGHSAGHLVIAVHVCLLASILHPDVGAGLKAEWHWTHSACGSGGNNVKNDLSWNVNKVYTLFGCTEAKLFLVALFKKIKIKPI